VLILSDWEDTAGISYAIKSAFDRYTDWDVRTVRWANNYLDYPTDIDYRGNKGLVADLFAKCDVVHMMQRVEHASAYPGWLDKAKVLHHHGTSFRQDPERMLRIAREIGAISLVSTHDLLLLGPDELEWLPNPVNLGHMRGLRNGHAEGTRLRVAHAPTSRQTKDTDALFAAAAGLPVDIDLIERTDWATCLSRKAQADLLFDQLWLGYGLNAIEAWGMGMPVIAGSEDERVLTLMRDQIGYLPFHLATRENLGERLREVVESRTLRTDLTERGRQYVADWHDDEKVVRRLQGIYTRAMDMS
jgi:glycosyltransferase involved in cell wall biosynthesis